MEIVNCRGKSDSPGPAVAHRRSQAGAGVLRSVVGVIAPTLQV
jgi:hypothetical protein